MTPKKPTIRRTTKAAAARITGRTLKIETPRIFLPLLAPSRYKGAYGGRGSGKSHFFAELLIEECLTQRGMLAVCIREVQKSLKDSSKRLIEVKLAQLGLGAADGFKIFEKQIETPGDGVIIFTGLQDSNNENIKSLEGFRRAWIEEAQVLSHRSLALLRPTIRATGSEIWASWNPRRKGDAVDDFLRTRRPKDAAVVEVNWRDNPWFPQVLEEERLTDLQLYVFLQAAGGDWTQPFAAKASAADLKRGGLVFTITDDGKSVSFHGTISEKMVTGPFDGWRDFREKPLAVHLSRTSVSKKGAPNCR